MRKLLITALLVPVLLIGMMALPGDAHATHLPMYTYTWDESSSCRFRAIYGQYGNNAFAEMQQVNSPGSKCSAWSGITLRYHAGGQVQLSYCSILGKVYSPTQYPQCALLGPGLGIRIVRPGALLQMDVHLCWWTFDPGEPYPPCTTHPHWVL